MTKEQKSAPPRHPKMLVVKLDFTPECVTHAI